ncbi:hypothetical protein CNMCM5623_006703 [Aspergillus felis]|uniref:Cell wall mannoprotein 1 n=1 Tax=Aspergillus felis TaxID=1287682 RepID=A0A8H6PTW7_9EURO|nr:hypothetical protein CNMCM5623_006703 [Aspergillus felis]KAF7176282.1 hypothetical protein CNMCM7691_002207 [Aspergillus felis]
MRFSALLVTLGLTGAMATPALVARQGGATGVISSIQAQTSALASAVSSYNGGDPSAVKSAADKLVSTINSGVDSVKSGADLSTADALALTSPVQDLTKQVQGVVNDLISKKDKFVAAGAGSTVYQQLQSQYTAADNLAKAISSKVPSSLSDIASQLSAGITAAIQKGVDAYKDVATSTGSSSSSSASATETKTATATATGTTTKTATSTAVIPTGTASGSASASPSGTATPTKSGSGSGTGSATASTSTNLLATGAASKEHFSYSLGGAVVAAAIAVAF